MIKRCLLIVDDEDEITTPILRKTLLDYSETYMPIVAVDGFDALESMRSRDIAVVILDIRMRNLDGWGVISQAKADPLMKSIPIIVSSGHLSDDDKVTLRGLGIEHILDKPYSMGELFKTVLLADKSSGQQKRDC